MMLQQKESQQRVMLELMEQQMAELAKYRKEILSTHAKAESRGSRTDSKLLKPIVQKIIIEHYIETYETEDHPTAEVAWLFDRKGHNCICKH